MLLWLGPWGAVVEAQSSPRTSGDALAAALAPPGEAHPRLVRAGQDVFWVQGRKRRWIVSPQVFADYRFREEWIEPISEQELTAIARGPDLVAGPVLRAPDGEIWVVYEGARRRVAGPDAFAPLYLSPDDAVPASAELLTSYPAGRPIGNPPRPWMAGIVIAVLLGAGWVWWFDRGGRRPSGGIWLVLGALVVAGTAFKVHYVALFPWLPDGADANAYATVARYLASGGSVLDDGPYRGLIGVTSPLYPFILAAFSWAVALAHESVVGWKLVQVAVAVALVPLTGSLAGRLYGPRAGRLAAVLAAISPLWLYSAELLQYELWLALSVLAGTWCLVQAAAQPQRLRWFMLAGTAYGLAGALQLKSVVLLAPAAACIVWLTWRVGRACQAGLEAEVGETRPEGAGQGTENRKTRGAPARGTTAPAVALVFFAAASAPLTAWGLRNVIVHGEPVIGSTAAGVIFWMGNHDGATGGIMQVPPPPALYEQVKRYPERSITRETRAYAALAAGYIAQHPSRFGVLALKKLERFWWTITPDRLGEYAEGRMLAFLGGMVDGPALTLFSKLLHLFTAVTLAAGVLGGGRLSAGAGGPATVGRWLVLSSCLLFWLVHIPFIAEPRYRIPIAPLLQVLQGTGLVVLRDALPLGRKGPDGCNGSDERRG